MPLLYLSSIDISGSLFKSQRAMFSASFSLKSMVFSITFEGVINSIDGSSETFVLTGIRESSSLLNSVVNLFFTPSNF